MITTETHRVAVSTHLCQHASTTVLCVLLSYGSSTAHTVWARRHMPRNGVLPHLGGPLRKGILKRALGQGPGESRRPSSRTARSGCLRDTAPNDAARRAA